MGQRFLHPVWISLAACVVFFTNLGVTGLWDMDEALYSTCAREMLDRDDWVTPVYNGELFPDKPPLMFWTMMAGFSLFGETEFAARFFSAVAGLATALLTYYLGRRLFSERAGLWAGLTMTSTLIFTISARAATVDASLTLLTTLAFALFVFGGVAGRGARQSDAQGEAASPIKMMEKRKHVRAYLPSSWFIWAGIWCCTAVAVLAKGPIGLLLPASSIGLFLMIMNTRSQLPGEMAKPSVSRWRRWIALTARCVGPRNFLRSLWQMRPLTGAAIVCLVAIPWYVLVGVRTDGQWLQLFFAKFNLRPFMSPILGHSGPFWYYVPAVLIGFFPYSVFLGPAIEDTAKRVHRNHPWHRGYILLLCWFGTWFVFWSICRTKLPHYVLPACPALALLTGCFLDGWIADPVPSGRWWPRIATGITVLAGLGLIVSLPFVASIYAPGEELLGLVGLILIPSAGIFLVLVEQGQRHRALVVFAVTSVAFLTAIFGFAAHRVDRHQNARPMLATVRADAQEHAIDKPALGAYGFLRWSTVFYAGQVIPMHEDLSTLTDPGQRQTAPVGPSKAPKSKTLGVGNPPTGIPDYLFTHERHLSKIEKHLPEEFEVIYRNRQFMKGAEDGEVLVLARTNRGRTVDRVVSRRRAAR